MLNVSSVRKVSRDRRACEFDSIPQASCSSSMRCFAFSCRLAVSSPSFLASRSSFLASRSLILRLKSSAFSESNCRSTMDPGSKCIGRLKALAADTRASSRRFCCSARRVAIRCESDTSRLDVSLPSLFASKTDSAMLLGCLKANLGRERDDVADSEMSPSVTPPTAAPKRGVSEVPVTWYWSD